MTRLRADIRLPPALAATWHEHAAELPTQTYLLVRAMREELFRRDIPIPPEPPPSQQAQAARARWTPPTGDAYRASTPCPLSATCGRPALHRGRCAVAPGAK